MDAKDLVLERQIRSLMTRRRCGMHLAGELLHEAAVHVGGRAAAKRARKRVDRVVDEMWRLHLEANRAWIEAGFGG